MKIRMVSPTYESKRYAEVIKNPHRYGGLSRDEQEVEAARILLTYLGPTLLDSLERSRLSQALSYGIIDGDKLAKFIDRFEEEGSVVSPEQVAAENPDNPEGTADVLAARGLLAAIARVAENLAGELGPLSTRASAACQEKHGQRLTELLGEAHGKLLSLETSLRDIRQAFIDEQLEKLGITESSRDLKLHIGCGMTMLDGWVNIDMGGSELDLNIKWGLPFPDNSVAYAYSGHVFEHLYHRSGTLAFAKELRRVCADGATVRLTMPSGEAYLRAYCEGDTGFFEEIKNSMPWFLIFDNPLEQLAFYYGSGRETAEFFGHKFPHDFSTVESVLKEAGFSSVRRCAYMESPHEVLRVDETSPANRITYKDKHYSLFVEATA